MSLLASLSTMRRYESEYRLIANNVAQASDDAEAGAGAMRAVEAAAAGALSTAGDVAGLSTLLREEAEKLDNAIRQFLTQVKAA
jgi:methyl-accepting chemotaxis protein